jgi:diadenosine tetraphosphate (Ap4A) HIT family hydrolase
VSLDRWWAGWRHEYLTAVLADEGDDGEGSLFERILASDRPDEETYVLVRGEEVSALLNAYPYNSGHLMVMPNRAVADLEDLTDSEESALWRTVREAVVAIKGAYSPEGVNIGMNLGRAAGAGIPGHLHVHCLPRWDGDTNFMTVVAETRVLPEPLDVTWKRLRDAWPA